jgi:hypothetical protein
MLVRFLAIGRSAGAFATRLPADHAQEVVRLERFFALGALDAWHESAPESRWPV